MDRAISFSSDAPFVLIAHRDSVATTQIVCVHIFEVHRSFPVWVLLWWLRGWCCSFLTMLAVARDGELASSRRVFIPFSLFSLFLFLPLLSSRRWLSCTLRWLAPLAFCLSSYEAFPISHFLVRFCRLDGLPSYLLPPICPPPSYWDGRDANLRFDEGQGPPRCEGTADLLSRFEAPCPSLASSSLLSTSCR